MALNHPTGSARSAAASKCAGPECQNAIEPKRAHITWKRYCGKACAGRARNERHWRKRLGVPDPSPTKPAAPGDQK